MYGKRLLLIVGKLILASVATPAFAIMSMPDGWYVEGNVGYSRLSDTSYDIDTDSHQIGGNVNVGYKFMPFLGIEAGYTKYANTDVTDAYDNKAGDVRHYSYDLAGKGIIPISNSGFEVFAKLGIQRINATINITDPAVNAGISDGSHTDTGLYLGIGGQYYFWPEMAIVAQWQQANGNSSTGTLALYSIGISYIFS